MMTTGEILTVMQGDALERLRNLPSGSVQLGVTSPPYDDLRTYGGFSWDFEGIAKELYRVLCDGGVLCWNVNDSVKDGSETLTSFKQAIFFVEQCGFRLHDTMIYGKTNFAHPETTRYHQLFEYVFVLSRGKPRTFNPIRDKKNIWAGTGTFGRNSMREPNGEMTVRARNIISEFGMRGNVWIGDTSGQEGALCQGSVHPAKMPEWLAHDLILSWSNTGDTVIDPFGGTGTTGKQSVELGRRAIVIELNPDYCELIEQRCTTTIGLALDDIPCLKTVATPFLKPEPKAAPV